MTTRLEVERWPCNDRRLKIIECLQRLYVMRQRELRGETNSGGGIEREISKVRHWLHAYNSGRARYEKKRGAQR